jgi:SCF-associated factor 1
VGVIADLQCGGWSTTLLSSQGNLYSVGILDHDEGRAVGPSFEKLTRLRYPSTIPFKRFSAGRKHVLGLDEDGQVWSWDRIDVPGVQIYDATPMTAFVVVGGWTVSSAYTRDGIVYWRVPAGVVEEGTDDEPENPAETHTAVELRHRGREFVKTTVIPGTASHVQQQQPQESRRVGEVLAYIVLEAYIVFITDLAKVFACRITNEDDANELSFEVTGFASQGRRHRDIQGSFRNFSVFTSTGEVLSGDQEYLDQLYSLRKVIDAGSDEHIIPLEAEASDLRRPADIPALQHTGVISVAYGDYHFHALHSDGRITSYGYEPQSSGGLGLGGASSGARFRGVNFRSENRWSKDGKMLPLGYRNGREIWFSQSQRAWLQRLEGTIRASESFPHHHHHHHHAFAVLNEDTGKQAAYSEWVEREGRAWEEGVDNEDGLRSHFALSVAAAGWHSAALVLENTDLVQKVKGKWSDKEGNYVWENMEFPRIRLPDGFEFPGSGELHEWKGGMPTREELEDSQQDASTS